MNVPASWRRMGSMLFDGFHRDGDDIRQSFRRALSELDGRERFEVVNYLGFLTSGALTREEQLELWELSGANVTTPKRQITEFLVMLKEIVSTDVGG